jgi:glutamate carboxypeptidase
MTSPADPLLLSLERQTDAMLRMLRHFVECESPSSDRAAVDRLGRLIAADLKRAGASVRFIASSSTGNHLRALFRGTDRRTRGQILLLAHMDTVWEMGTLKRMPFRIRAGRAYGPGAFDMKAGIVMALFAISSLRRAGVSLPKDVVFLLNADEEIGSPSSRASTEREARRSDYVLVVEPPHGPRGALKTARKGVGDFRIQVRGRAAHAGIEPEKGASAITELARQILHLQSLADHTRGITISAGVVHGGTRSNVIPAEAEAQMDVRVRQSTDQRKIERAFRSRRPFDMRTSVRVSGGFNRPPMERTARTAALFERARRLATPLGIKLTETAVGGGSDGNFTAALGVPTLDGLGAVGDGAHAEHEHVVVRELPRRTALLAHLIASLASD